MTAYRAGHVLGAAMFNIEIGGMNLLYTGDYSRLADRHLSEADLPDTQPEIGGPLNHTLSITATPGQQSVEANHASSHNAMQTSS